LARIEQLEKQASAPAERKPASTAPAAVLRSEADTVIIPELPVRQGPSARQAFALKKRVAAAEAAAQEARVDAKGEVALPSAAPPVTAGEPAAEPASRFASTVKSRYKEVFDLHDSGKSIEYIAKKLGKNKGEVQLILGLAKQEEPVHGQP
ncbi:MAG TPA: hypothetical protein VEZ72_07425, partial [Paenibacillus sp.]|nr:hypothetical protein [Paenibacillus sp.]